MAEECECVAPSGVWHRGRVITMVVLGVTCSWCALQLASSDLEQTYDLKLNIVKQDGEHVVTSSSSMLVRRGAQSLPTF